MSDLVYGLGWSASSRADRPKAAEVAAARRTKPVGRYRIQSPTVQLRNRERDATPFVTKDGSTIREYHHTVAQSLAEASLEPGAATRRHYHGRSEEIYLILEGGGDLDVEGETQAVAAGDAVVIPPGSWHELTAHGEGVRLLCCCVPPYSDDDTLFA